MNYYLIDYENVKEAELNGIDKLSEDDIVYILGSGSCHDEHSENISD